MVPVVISLLFTCSGHWGMREREGDLETAPATDLLISQFRKVTRIIENRHEAGGWTAAKIFIYLF